MELHITINIEKVIITSDDAKHIVPQVLTVKKELKEIVAPLKPFEPATIIKQPVNDKKNGKNKKYSSAEFHAEHFAAITDLDKRMKALGNKRWLMKKAGKLTNIINAEIQSMLDLCKELKKKSKRNR